MTDITEKHKAMYRVMRDLQSFVVEDIPYISNSMGYQDSIDNMLWGEVKALAGFCDSFGWSDLADSLNEYVGAKGSAVVALSHIRSFVITEIVDRISNNQYSVPVKGNQGIEHQKEKDELGAHMAGKKVFIGHGQSNVWKDLKDFLSDRLDLEWDEFNKEAVAGLSTFERIAEMLDAANFAFLIMTAEDEHSDDDLHARQNVVHEVGLFQGRLGPKKAIILLEEGCSEFSNIVGLSQIRFPKGNISAKFEDIRRVLERESII